jgi:glycosyltransferase involved in cell wall biosynthesis
LTADTFHFFFSVVVVVRDAISTIDSKIKLLEQTIEPLVADYQIIIIDNASSDGTFEYLEGLLGIDGYKNIQGFSLANRVNDNTAAWVGVENSLGDFVLNINLDVDDISIIPEMLEACTNGYDVVFGRNSDVSMELSTYWIFRSIYKKLYRTTTSLDLSKDAPTCRILSRQVVNYISKQSLPHVAYRFMPGHRSFNRKYIEFNMRPKVTVKHGITVNISRGMELLTTSSVLPMRFVTLISLTAAVFNLLYSLYVVVITLSRDDIEPGWASMSLQLSGMFIIVAVVLMFLSEYMLHIARVTEGVFPYHINREVNSARIESKQKPNVKNSER